MPYAESICGIYKIVNVEKGDCYVGQSQNVKKRISEHFRLLRNGAHPNPKLQNAFRKYGEDKFKWSLEVLCESPDDLDMVEEAFLKGEATFLEPTFYNIADFSRAPMRGKAHSPDVRKKISESRRKANFDFRSEQYRKTLSEAQTRRFFSDKNFVEKVKFIVENDHLTYAQRGRLVGNETGSVRRLYLRYKHLKGEL